jgi:cytoskeletal protein RodZ
MPKVSDGKSSPERKYKMNNSKWILLCCVVVLAIVLMISTGCTKKVEEQEGETQSTEQEEKAKVEIPTAVAKVIQNNVPNAEIAKVEVAADGTLIEPLKWNTE